VFWTRPDVVLAANRQKPDRADATESYGGLPWQRWSRHLNGWRLETDNLETFFAANGSGLSDVGLPKADIAERHSDQIGTGTLVNPMHASVCDQAVAQQLRDCDIVFGCTDEEVATTTRGLVHGRHH